MPKFNKGLKANLPTSGLTPESYYQCTDTGELFYAVNATTLINVTKIVTEAVDALKLSKQDLLTSGVNIKSINNKSILGDGNLQVGAGCKILPEEADSTITDLEGTYGQPTLKKVRLSSSFSASKITLVENIQEGADGIVNHILFYNDSAVDVALEFAGGMGTALYPDECRLIRGSVQDVTWMKVGDTYIIQISDPLSGTHPLPCLRFENVDDTDFDISADPHGRNLEVSADGVVWRTMSGAETITIPAKKSVYFRGTNAYGVATGEYDHMGFSSQPGGHIKAYGSVMTLLGYNPVPIDIPSNSCFHSLFSSFKSLVKAPELPATSLKGDCYRNMFYHCVGLVEGPPELPAVNWASSCYNMMFDDCPSLSVLPKFPDGIKPYGFYDAAAMFRGCKSIIETPHMHFEHLGGDAMAYAFQNCSSLKEAYFIVDNFTDADGFDYALYSCPNLNKITCLSPNASPGDWLNGSYSPTGVFVKSPGVEWPRGNNGIPPAWEVKEAE